MSVISPCLTVETDDQYKAMVEKIKLFAQRVQIDISDGEFAPIMLVPIERLWWPSDWVVDIHAMVMRPDDYIDKLIKLKPNLIIFHVETGVDLLPIIKKIQQFGIKAGVAFLRQTAVSKYEQFIKAADHVLIFSGDLGYYGGKASLMQLEKVRQIKAINPTAEIGWDGGVNISNAFMLTRGSVNVLNVGGAIAKATDPAAVYNELNKEINRQGIF